MSEPADSSEDTELDAIKAVYNALKPLDDTAQQRVLDYVLKRLSLTSMNVETGGGRPTPVETPHDFATLAGEKHEAPPPKGDSEELEGISPVAQKWMRRNGLTEGQLSSLFSLGVEDIDLVAPSVPGRNKKDKMRAVLLLQAVAGYLSTGSARVSDEKLREACGHYSAYDVGNFAKYLRELGAEVSGARDGGYSLTSRGLAAARDLIKEMTAQSGK